MLCAYTSVGERSSAEVIWDADVPEAVFPEEFAVPEEAGLGIANRPRRQPRSSTAMMIAAIAKLRRAIGFVATSTEKDLIDIQRPLVFPGTTSTMLRALPK